MWLHDVTRFSYFYEAFEGLGAIEDPTAAQALKYMLLCKVMMDSPEDVQNLVLGKLALKFAGQDISAMLAVAKAYKHRSLDDFERVIRQYPKGMENVAI